GMVVPVPSAAARSTSSRDATVEWAGTRKTSAYVRSREVAASGRRNCTGEDSRNSHEERTGPTDKDRTMTAASPHPGQAGDAGYSGTPLPGKLGVKPGSRVLVLDAPEGFDLGVDVTTTLERDSRGAEPPMHFDVLLVF